jgi:hypothetical protein
MSEKPDLRHVAAVNDRRHPRPTLTQRGPGAVRSATTSLLHAGNELHPDAVAEYVRSFADPRTIAATCADYRAAATTDLEHDDASFAAGTRIECPTLAVWGRDGVVGRLYDVVDAAGRGDPHAEPPPAATARSWPTVGRTRSTGAAHPSAHQ